MAVPAEPAAVLEALVRAEVRFVAAGRLAGRLHGAPLVPSAAEVVCEPSEATIERLAAALLELWVDERAPFDLDGNRLQRGGRHAFNTGAGRLEVLGASEEGFELLDRAAVAMDLGGFTVRVACLDDLIHMARAAGEMEDLEELGALREEIDERAAQARRTTRSTRNRRPAAHA